MSNYRTEFDRRVKAVLLPNHAEHDMAGVEVVWTGDEGSGCDTCGYEARADVYARGTCSCGLRVWADRALTAYDLPEFMREITK